jgi:hypothetical protein
MEAAKQSCIWLAVVITTLFCPLGSKAGSSGDTVIQIDFFETHDRLTPEERSGIVAQPRSSPH